ncbi:MAG: sensor histidine kinase, partial [Acidobacteria bacterium]|nr:sensor histidine kinase [Acidobacteriota bacterium]
EFDRLTRLINQILTLARADAGEIRLANEPVDLAALASSVAEQLEPVAAARGLALTCEGAGPVMVRGDAGWLQRLLLILLDNAIKFTPDGGRIAMTVSRASGLAQVTVADTGIGVPADVLPHLFERFYRANRAKSRQTEGAGLGLALAHWIAERHQATISVTSAPGEGSTFTVRLPAAPVSMNAS